MSRQITVNVNGGHLAVSSASPNAEASPAHCVTHRLKLCVLSKGTDTMEVKVSVDGIPRVVCGVTEETTCQEVVIALAQALGKCV